MTASELLEAEPLFFWFPVQALCQVHVSAEASESEFLSRLRSSSVSDL